MIVVDMQNGFLDDEGSMAKTGMDITELKKNGCAGMPTGRRLPQR